MEPKKADVEETQQELVPDSKEESAETQDVGQETEENLETPAGGSEDLELPQKGVSDRTREQFDKLRSQLREYRERLFNEQRYREIESGSEQVEPIYDKTTGLVNIAALEDMRKRTAEANKKIRELEQQIQATHSDTQSRELHSAYPELKNPKTKEAKELFDEAEKIWMHSQAYPEKYGGLSLTQKEAADIAKKKMGTKQETQQQEAQRVESKEQASLGTTGRPTQGVQGKVRSEEEHENLILGTRLGDKDSMIARMRAIREAESQSPK